MLFTVTEATVLLGRTGSNNVLVNESSTMDRNYEWYFSPDSVVSAKAVNVNQD